MYQNQEQTTWRNVARHEETFNDALYATLKSTPWWVISIAVHAILIGVLFTQNWSTGGADVNAEIQSSLQDQPIKPIKDIVKPEIQETKPIEQKDKVIPDPVVKDAKVSDHNETDNNQPFQEQLGKKNFISDAPFNGPSTNAEIGIGGGAGGAFGGRGGHMNLRAEGGSGKTEEAVNLGLEWLKNHQDPGGFWDCDGFQKM